MTHDELDSTIKKLMTEFNAIYNITTQEEVNNEN